MHRPVFATLAMVAGCPLLQADALDEPCHHLEEAVASWRQQHPAGTVRLILGTTPGDPALANVPDTFTIYLDGRTGAGLAESHIQADFNNSLHLSKVAMALWCQVDLVLFEGVAARGADWGRAELLWVRTMLRPGGVLFLPSPRQAEALPVFLAHTLTGSVAEEAERLVKDNTGNGRFPTRLKVPSNWGKLPAALQEQVRLGMKAKAQAMLEEVFAQVEVRSFLRSSKAGAGKDELAECFVCRRVAKDAKGAS